MDRTQYFTLLNNQVNLLHVCVELTHPFWFLYLIQCSYTQHAGIKVLKIFFISNMLSKMTHQINTQSWTFGWTYIMIVVWRHQVINYNDTWVIFKKNKTPFTSTGIYKGVILSITRLFFLHATAELITGKNVLPVVF